jgi:hypothetical protein
MTGNFSYKNIKVTNKKNNKFNILSSETSHEVTPSLKLHYIHYNLKGSYWQAKTVYQTTHKSSM